MADLITMVLTPLISAVAGGLLAGFVTMRRIEREFDLRRQERWADHQVAILRELSTVANDHFEAVRKTLGVIEGHGRMTGQFRPPTDVLGRNEQLFDKFGDAQGQMRILANLVGVQNLPTTVDEVIDAANQVIGSTNQNDIENGYRNLVERHEKLIKLLSTAARSVFMARTAIPGSSRESRPE